MVGESLISLKFQLRCLFGPDKLSKGCRIVERLLLVLACFSKVSRGESDMMDEGCSLADLRQAV